jgi:hypothetical protein
VADQVADPRDGGAVAPVEHADAPRRAVEEAGQRGLVAADRQLEQGGVEAGGEHPAADEGGALGIPARSRRRGPAGRREIHRIERQPAPDQPARQAVDEAQQPLEGEHPARRVGVGGQGAGFGDAQLGVVAGAPDAHRQVGQHDGEEAPGRSRPSARLGAPSMPRHRNSKLPGGMRWANRPKPSSPSSAMTRL